MKELSQQAWYYFEPIGQNMAKELNIKRDDFFQLSYEEIISSYKIGHCVVSSKNINNRKKGFILGKVDNKKIIIDNQKNVNNVYDYFDKIKIDDVKEFSGSSASRGKISGEIKIIINKKDFRKFKKGKILVTTMTTPDYVVLMKQASAIITNEGGLSCHAAIVARELGKPCIIGTKFATQVLHDGDSVEVDANKGNC